jgi:hypothetical protein
MNAAFAVVFGIFVVLILGLAFVSIRWGVRRDREAVAQRRREAKAERNSQVKTPGHGDDRERA